MLPRALLVDDPIFSEHHASEPNHPERPERLEAARRATERASQFLNWTQLAARDASEDELVRVHTEDYLKLLGQTAGKTGMFDSDTFVSPRSMDAARRAAGSSVELAHTLTNGAIRLGAALLRPPGHHARPGTAMGFCLLNNAAIAAAAARAHGASRVLILDWDVHHGNGTEEMFWDDPAVLYVSLHQSPYYPGTGAAEDIGGGEGRGFTVNVPLSAGADDSVYRAAFERVVLPIVEQFAPTLTLISAGFDAHTRDPLGGMTLSDAGFGALAASLKARLPQAHPIGLLLEGGYDLVGLEGALASSLQALVTNAPVPPRPSTPLSAAHEHDISRAERAQTAFWRLS